jgi:hypothetical protein
VRIGSRKCAAADIGRLIFAYRRRLLGRKRRHCAETLDIGRSRQGAEPRETFSNRRFTSMSFRDQAIDRK